MYANVMNSYDYDLISSFFCKFTKPDVRFEKRSACGFFPLVLAQGLDLVIKYFLILLQVAPDKVTRVSELFIRQSSLDISHAEVTCKFTVANSAIYDLQPQVMRSEEFHAFLKETPTIRSTSTSVPRVSIEPANNSCIVPLDPAKSVFDPISGNFLASRFKRLEDPIRFQVEGQLTFVVNEEKWIEAIVVNHMRKVPLTLEKTN